MKKVAMFVAACALAAAVPVMGQTKVEKECLIYSRNCANEVMSIQEKVEKLNQEVKKGKAVYSAKELQKLEQKLKEANKILDSLNTQGGGGN